MAKDKNGKGMNFEPGSLVKHFDGKPSPVPADEFNQPRAAGDDPLTRMSKALKDDKPKR